MMQSFSQHTNLRNLKMTTKYVLTIYSASSTDHYTFESKSSREELEVYLASVFANLEMELSSYIQIDIGTKQIRTNGYGYDLQTLNEWFDHNSIRED